MHFVFVFISTCGMALDTNFPTKRDKSKLLKENNDFGFVHLYTWQLLKQPVFKGLLEILRKKASCWMAAKRDCKSRCNSTPFMMGSFCFWGQWRLVPPYPYPLSARRRLPPVSRGPLCKTLLKCWMRKTNWTACGWSFRSANAYSTYIYMGYIYVYILYYISTIICNTYFSLNWTYAVGRVCVHDEWLVPVTTYNYTFTAKVGDLDAGPDA